MGVGQSTVKPVLAVILPLRANAKSVFAVLVKVPHCVGVTVMVSVALLLAAASTVQTTVPPGVPGGGVLVQPEGLDADSKFTLSGSVSVINWISSQHSLLVKVMVKVRGCPTTTGLGLAVLSKQPPVTHSPPA